MKRSVLFTAMAAGVISLCSSAMAKPLKIYIMAGQSNMEGHAAVRTFDHIGMDPKTAPMLKEMRNADGTPRVCDNVWISYLTGGKDGNIVKQGKLTADYGSQGKSRRSVLNSPSAFSSETDQRADPDYQDCLGREELVWGLPVAQRRKEERQGDR